MGYISIVSRKKSAKAQQQTPSSACVWPKRCHLWFLVDDGSFPPSCCDKCWRRVDRRKQFLSSPNSWINRRLIIICIFSFIILASKRRLVRDSADQLLVGIPSSFLQNSILSSVVCKRSSLHMEMHCEVVNERILGTGNRGKFKFGCRFSTNFTITATLKRAE